MAPPRKLPRPFELHWGRGQIVEEASYEGEYHVPAIQLLQYTEGEAAGSLSVRFCTYNHRGAFQRSPLIVSRPGGAAPGAARLAPPASAAQAPAGMNGPCEG